MQSVTLSVSGMSCQHCVQTVHQAVAGVAGVSGCQVDLEQGRVAVTLAAGADPAATRQAVAAAIVEEGYTVND